MTNHLASLLGLPLELRCIIYTFYVFEPEGYHYNYESNRLRRSDGSPIDLALMYTCTAIATEMRYFALEKNIINFATIFSEGERLKAGSWGRRLSVVMEYGLHNLFRTTSNRPVDFELKVPITPEIQDRMAKDYPEFESLLRSWRRWGNFPAAKRKLLGNWGQAMSRFHGFCVTLMMAMDTEPGWDDVLYIHHNEPISFLAVTRHKIMKNTDETWTIPSQEEVDALEVAWPHEEITPGRVKECCLHQINWRYSAVAGAIKFLDSLRSETRLRLRRLVVDEDQASVAWPERHAAGLIPYCKENSKLKITRRVNLWRTAVPLADPKFASAHPELNNGYSAAQEKDPSLEMIQQAFVSWITEALALPNLGMPPNSFTLEFTHTPWTRSGPGYFEKLKLRGAWQAAQDEWLSRADPDWSHNDMAWDAWTARRRSKCYVFENAPQVISDIVEGRGFIRCAFDTGPPITPADILDKTMGLDSYQAWDNAYRSKSTHLILRPLPTSETWEERFYERFRREENDEVPYENGAARPANT